MAKPVRNFLKSAVDVPRWLAWDQIAEAGKNLTKTAKDTFVPPTARHRETFEEAMVRLRLSEEQIEKQRKAFLGSSVVYLAIGGAVFAYAVYLALDGHVMATLFSGVLAALCWTYAYRESFWYMQMTQRRLGCTVKGWLAFMWGRLLK